MTRLTLSCCVFLSHKMGLSLVRCKSGLGFCIKVDDKSQSGVGSPAAMFSVFEVAVFFKFPAVCLPVRVTH